ncbi:enoyl-CoA hydratase [Pueribacillus theae]|uniref:Enoyl-CoA hydratase n=1 Tax=Pueribacillus theae TaxID=2171751 RepID=A0A2U1JRY1_9BACI|nr:enoyl-CoA hydratase/isomerase family protein [Pueribacillus theae]PWA07709.1 enoyl-CoA hydratase [Pueribacillus theae]
MTANNLVSYERAEHIAKITLQRPEKLNAFNRKLVKDLHHAWVQFEQDDEARVAIITGEGKHFSAGLDINDFTPVSPAIPGTGAEVTKPIIAALNGYCIGIGLVVAFMSDIRICTEDAQFIYPEAKIGYTGGVGSLLANVIPQGIALEMLLVGEGISAKRAYEVGLVNHIVPKEQLMDEALNMARKIANNAPLVVQALKKFARDTSLMEKAGIGNRIIGQLTESKDRSEGFAAFSEKRSPHFTGK